MIKIKVIITLLFYVRKLTIFFYLGVNRYQIWLQEMKQIKGLRSTDLNSDEDNEHRYLFP